MSTDVKWTEWVQRELTNCASLAYVGSDLSTLVKDRIPITDLVWMTIAKEGRVEAIDRVIAEFFWASCKAATTTAPKHRRRRHREQRLPPVAPLQQSRLVDAAPTRRSFLTPASGA